MFKKFIFLISAICFITLSLGLSPSDAATVAIIRGGITLYTFNTVQEAFNNIVLLDGDTVTIVDPGTYSEHLQWPNVNNITLEGNPSNSPNQIIIDGNSTDSVIDIDYPITATIKNLTIQNGWLDSDDGAGIYANAGSSGTLTLTLMNCIVKDNTIIGSGSGHGAGIYGGNSQKIILNIYDSIFSNNNNRSNGIGGAIYVPTGNGTNRVNIKKTVFLNNEAYSKGSAITLGQVTATINNSLFYDNEISADADSTIYMGAGSLYFTNNTIADNEGIGLSATSNSTSITLNAYNNIFYNNSDNDFVIKTHSDGYFKRNIYGSTITSFEFKECKFYDNIKTSNPGFNSAGSHDYKLKNDSVAINAGQNSAMTESEDVSQNTRIQNTIIDIGAYESSYSASAGSISLKRNGTTVGTYPMIQLALNAASSGDHIVLSEGTYSENLDWPETTALTLEGEGSDATKYKIDAQEEGPGILIFGVASVNINNLTIQNGRFISGGGIIYSVNEDLSYLGRLNIDNCYIQDNVASGDGLDDRGMGGGIECMNTNLDIRNSVIKGNSAVNCAGIVVWSNCNKMPFLYIYNSTIIDNEASNKLGGVLGTSEVTVENCTFESNVVNSTSGVGGAVFTLGNASINKCIFRQNNGQLGGDAVYAHAGYATIKDSLFYENNGSYVITLADPQDIPSITMNYTLQPAKGKIINCTFANNNSIAVVSKSQSEIINTIFYDSEGCDIESFTSPNYSLTLNNSYYENVSGNIDTESNNIISGDDPGFNNISNNDYTLKSTSTVIDDGLNSAVTNPGSALDLAGFTRIIGQSVDIGSYEYQGSIGAGVITPSSGSGGITVVISGSGFQAGAAVKFAGENATDVSVISSAQISCKVPALSTGGTVNVVVTNPDNTVITFTSGFAYIIAPILTVITPNIGTVEGGDTVNITGSNFQSGMTVKIGANYCTSVNVTSSTALTAFTPSGNEGSKDVSLTYNGATSTYTDKFTYETYLDTLAIIADSAQEGTSNIHIIGTTGETILAKDPDINLTIGITEIVSGNYAVLPLISLLVKGQRIYIQSLTTPGRISSIITVGTTIGPYLAGGLYDKDHVVRGLGGEADQGSSIKVLKLGSGSNSNKLKVSGSGTINSNHMFTISLGSELDDGNMLVPLINGVAGTVITVGSTKGPSIKWPQNANTTAIEGIGRIGEEVRAYDVDDLSSVKVTENVGSSGTYDMTINRSNTTQGNILCVIGYSSDGIGILGGIFTVGVDGGPKINISSTNQVKDGDTQVSGTGTAQERVVIESTGDRNPLGNAIVGSDGSFTTNLDSALQGQHKIVSVENNISGEIITVAGTGASSIMGDYGNYPNPFDPNKENTTIEYTLNQNVNVVIHIYNINTIEVLAIDCPSGSEGGKAGINRVLWDGKDGYGAGCSTGVYLYRIFDTDSKKVLGKGKIALIRK